MPVQNAASVTRTAANTYTIENEEEVYSLIVRVEELVDGEYDELDLSAEITPGNDYEYVFSADGVYRITVGTYQAGTLIKPDYYDVVIYSAINTCRINFIKSLICNDDDDCEMANVKYHSKLYYYNALMEIFYVFRLEVNDLLVNYWGYTVLGGDEHLTKLTDIETIINKMVAYCKCVDTDCGCGC